MSGTLKTTYQSGDRLFAADLNSIDAAVNANVATLAASGTNLATFQQILAKAQQDLQAAAATITAQATTIETLQAAATTAENRLAVLENTVAPPAVPLAPLNLVVGTITTTSIAVSASPPAAGPSPTGYSFRYARAGTGVWTSTVVGPALSVNITGLTPGAAYDLTCQAFNAAGPGGISSPVVTRSTTSSIAASPAWTEIPKNTNTLTLPDGSRITLVGGVVLRDVGLGAGPVPLGSTASVTIVLVNDHGVLYQFADWITWSGWWYADLTLQDPWILTSDPRPAAVPVKTRLLSFLNSVAAVGKVISGQFSAPSQADFDADTATLGFPVGLMTNGLWTDTTGIFDGSFTTRSIAHWTAGGLVGVQASWPNPNGNGAATSGALVNATQVITAGTALNNALVGSLDQAAVVLAQFKTAGVAVIFDSLRSVDSGTYFWWGSVNFTAAQYIALWRYMWTYLTTTKGLDNLVWMYSASGGPDPSTVISGYYPGDTYVDGTGVLSYTNTPATFYPTVFTAEKVAAPTKFAAFTEFGAADTTFDANILISGVKNRTWGAPAYIMAQGGTTQSWRFLQNAIAALSDPVVLNRNNMNRGF